MNPEYLRLGMDSFLLFFLVLTVYFAFRLSKNLREFRSYRSELEKIMHTLATQLERAQSVIQDIKEISKVSGQDIDMLVAESRMAVEDLRAVNEVSEALANRLERLAKGQGGRDVNPFVGKREDVEGESIQGILDDLKQELAVENEQPDIPAFLKKPSETVQEASEGPKKKLKSAAEQDLYEALLKKKK